MSRPASSPESTPWSGKPSSPQLWVKGWGEQALEVVQQAKARDLLDALGNSAPTAPERGASPRIAADLRDHAGNGTVLEYFLGETDLYLWVIRRDSIRMTDLGARAPVLAAAALHPGSWVERDGFYYSQMKIS